MSLADGRAAVAPYRYVPHIDELNFPWKKSDIGELGFGGERFALELDGIIVVGFDQGEFGGSLWSCKPDGRHCALLAQENVHGFAKLGHDLVAIVGLSHLFTSEGGLLRLGWNGGRRVKVLERIDLGVAPQAYVQDGDRLLIVTSDGLLEYRNGRASRLVTADYNSLYPNSIVVTEEGPVFIGMRHVIVRIDRVDDRLEETWLAPPNCVGLVRARGTRCDCIPAH